MGFPLLETPEAPPELRWTAMEADAEVRYFAESAVDDDAVLWDLPFPFPFYGQWQERVWISSK